MSAHCVNCGTDMVYGHAADWQSMTCPVCDLRAEVARLEQKCAMWEALAEKGKEWTIAAEADLAAARAREQRIDEPASKLTGDESARIREAFNQAWDALGDGATVEQRQDAADALERLRMTGGPLMRWHAVIAALAAEPAATLAEGEHAPS